MKIIKNIVICLTLFTTSVASLAADIDVSGQYIRETIPGTKISSAYMTITNNQAQDIELVSISSSISSKIELHEHSMSNGMMQMQQVESIIIKANDDVVLQPHGYHVMIFGLDQPLKANSTANMTLQFSNGKTHIISVPVKGIKQLEHHH